AADAGAGLAGAGDDVGVVAVWSLLRRAFSPGGSGEGFDGDRLGGAPGGGGGGAQRCGGSPIRLRPHGILCPGSLIFCHAAVNPPRPVGSRNAFFLLLRRWGACSSLFRER